MDGIGRWMASPFGMAGWLLVSGSVWPYVYPLHSPPRWKIELPEDGNGCHGGHRGTPLGWRLDGEVRIHG